MAPTMTPAANRARVCAACAWTSYPRPRPNGRYSIEWAIPENCESCGEPLPDPEPEFVRDDRSRKLHEGASGAAIPGRATQPADAGVWD